MEKTRRRSELVCQEEPSVGAVSKSRVEIRDKIGELVYTALNNGMDFENIETT